MIKEIVKNNRFALKAYYYLNDSINHLKSIRLKYAYKNAKHPSITEHQAVKYNLHRVNGPQKLLCNAPFTSLFINMNGNVNVCGYNKTFIIGNLNETTLNEIWKGVKHQQLMDSIKNFDLSNGCQSCQQRIETEDYHRAAIYFDTPKADNNFHLKKITFELSNLCNLECVMCNGELSSLIRKNVEKRAPLKLYSFDQLSEQLTIFIPNLQFVQFLGGEPLLIKSYYDIWNKIISANPTCTISVQINGTVLPQNFIKLLDNSNQFIISVSIDSFNKENYERIRINGNFEALMNNFKTLYNYKKLQKIELSINFVPMTWNWKEIPVAVEFANKHTIMLSMCEVDSPFEFSFYSISSTELENIIQYLNDNRPKDNSNIYEIQNLKLYKNQEIQIHHIYKLVKKSEEMFDLKISNETVSSAEKKYDYNTSQLPVYNEKIKEYLNVNFKDKIKHESPNVRLQLLNEFNRYHSIRTSFFKQNKIDYIETENFEGLVINELKSVIKTIFQKG